MADKGKAAAGGGGGGGGGGGKGGGKGAEVSEYGRVHFWKKRVEMENLAQRRYAEEWGSLLSADGAGPSSLDDVIAEKRRELEALRAEVGDASPLRDTAARCQMKETRLGLESFRPVERDVDRELASVKGRFKTRGTATMAATASSTTKSA